MNRIVKEKKKKGFCMILNDIAEGCSSAATEHRQEKQRSSEHNLLMGI